MKRLTLDAFNAQKITPKTQMPVDQFLGQILGDCHDGPRFPTPTPAKTGEGDGT